MSQLDRIREDIGYKKVWMGVLLVTEISLIAWLTGNYRSAGNLLLISDILAIMALAGAAVNLHFGIEKKIESLERFTSQCMEQLKYAEIEAVTACLRVSSHLISSIHPKVKRYRGFIRWTLLFPLCF